ncbi:MAG TPA: tyrosine-type recombinase/integrase [Candidatus Bathyarchaeia archaeon]|nr:tyrosine-type recombinase/integrase [Candidatus Bathyarchaeia archaeon]
MGLYQRSGSRFWWMSYTMQDERYFESTKTTSKELANKIWKKREGEIALGLFKVGWPGERMTFAQLCEEFERSHFAGLAKNTVRGHRTYLSHLKAFFGNCCLDKITVKMVETYRDRRRQQPSKHKPNQTLKGATVNRELECLKCVLDLATQRKYIPENPAEAVKHFNEFRDRPVRKMLTLEEERRILEAAQPYLRVAIILLSQTGGRTYSEGLSLRWDQVDFQSKVIRLDNDVKTPGSVEPIPLSEYACEVLAAWKQEQGSTSSFLFPSPVYPDRPISTVKTAWKATLRRAGVSPFPLYNLRHVFCTRLSEVAADAVVQRAMRHTSPETKRRYQLGMAEEVRRAVDKANKRLYGKRKVLHFRDSSIELNKQLEVGACN